MGCTRLSQDDVRDGTLIGPVLELEILQGQEVIDRLDIAGEDIAVIHCEVAGKSGPVGAEAAGNAGEEAVDAPGVS